MLSYILPGRLPGEKIVKILRKDGFIFFKKVILVLVLAGLPAAIGAIALSYYPGWLNGEFTYPLIVLAVSGYGLFIWLFFFFSFIDYYLDVWVITDERIIDVKQEAFFSRTVSELKLFQIQDVTSEIKGAFGFIFRYGDVYVQTAAEVSRFAFRQIDNPEGIRDTIIKLAEKKKHDQHPA